MEKLLDLTSRKFLYALLITCMGFYLVNVGKVSAEDFLTFCGVVGATYIIGNVTQKLIQ